MYINAFKYPTLGISWSWKCEEAKQSGKEMHNSYTVGAYDGYKAFKYKLLNNMDKVTMKIYIRADDPTMNNG